MPFIFISGFGYSSWTSRIPGIKESLQLNDALRNPVVYDAGWAYTHPALTGKLLDHYKSRTIMLAGAMMYNVVLGAAGFQQVYMGVGYRVIFFRVLQEPDEYVHQCAGYRCPGTL